MEGLFENVSDERKLQTPTVVTNNNQPIIYSGSADIMVRSFDRRLESLFLIEDQLLKQEVTNILAYNLSDNVNSYIMNEDSSYTAIKSGDKPFNIHKEFFKVNKEIILNASLN